MNKKASKAEMAQGEAIERAAKFFGVLATPVRLKIIGELCASETNVTHLLSAINVSQPNMSRHLNVLFKAGIVSRRRSGANVFYALANPSVVSICKTVCTEMDAEVASSRGSIEI
jgi:ArsR family transcriptional regulator